MKTFSSEWFLRYFGVSVKLAKKSEMDDVITRYSKNSMKNMKSQEEMMTDISTLAKKDGLKPVGYGTGLFIGTSGDRDHEIEMRIHHVPKFDNPNVLRKTSVYIDARTAKEIIDHLNKVFGFSE